LFDDDGRLLGAKVKFAPNKMISHAAKHEVDGAKFDFAPNKALLQSNGWRIIDAKIVFAPWILASAM